MTEKYSKILVISTTFPPRGGSSVQRVAKFVKYLRCYGFEPVVLTCDEPGISVSDSTLLDDIPAGTEIAKVPKKIGNVAKKSELIKSYKSKTFKQRKYHLKRFLYPDEYALWAIRAVYIGINILIKKDIQLIFSSFGSPSTLFLGYFLARKFSLPWYVDVRDFWSLNEMNFQYTRRRFPISLLDTFFDRFFMRRASGISVVSDYYKEELVKKFKINAGKITVIYNGYDEDDFKAVKFTKDNGVFRIRYIGFLMKEQRIDCFLEALQECAGEFRHKFTLDFVGGNSPEYIHGLVQKSGLLKVTQVIGYQPHGVAVRIMMEADVLLLIPGLGKGTITGKLFEYMRSGAPILMLDQGNRDAKRILNRMGCGLVVDAGDKVDIKNALKCLYTDWVKSKRHPHHPSGIAKVGQEFSRYKLTDKLVQTFRKHIQ